MAELVQAVIKRNLLYTNSDSVWLLALLSSSTICTIYLYSILPQVIDFLYLTISSSDEITHANEVCYLYFLRNNYKTLYINFSYFRLQHPYVY